MWEVNLSVEFVCASFGEGGQGPGRVVGLYLELNTKYFHMHGDYQCSNGKLNTWTGIIIGIFNCPKNKSTYPYQVKTYF